MIVANADFIRSWDAFTIEHEPIASIDLMERAALRCTNEIVDQFPNAQSFLICCGSGNNGGDGLVMARLLLEKNKNVIVLTPDTQKRSIDNQINLDLLKKRSPSCIVYEWKDPLLTSFQAEIIVDALLGTGIEGEVREPVANVIEEINRHKATTISVDIPSGLPTDIAQCTGNEKCVQADLTITFEVPKESLLYPHPNDCVGELHVLPIGLHPEFVSNYSGHRFVLHPTEVAHLLKQRDHDSAKWNYGHTLMICGSLEKPGAASLATLACLRSGTGLCTLLSHPKVCDLVIGQHPEIMAAHWSGKSTPDHRILEGKTAIGVGPGCGLSDAFKQLLKWLFHHSEIPMLIDADAINILSEEKTWLALARSPIVLTPHIREFARLCGVKRFENEMEIEDQLKDFCRKFNAYILLKGRFSRLCTPSGNIYFNITGNSGLATAGSGDVLTGIISGLLSQNYSPFEAVALGVCLHGLSAELATDRQSVESMMASDVSSHLGSAFKLLHHFEKEN